MSKLAFLKDQEARDAANKKHCRKPKVGDFWQECFAPVCVVIDASKFVVTTCELTKNAGNNKWTWDFSELKTYTRAEFVNRFRYGRIGNDDYQADDGSDDIKHKFWCDVIPKSHKWARKAAKEAQK